MLGGLIKELIKKCKIETSTLRWEDNVRYFINLALHLSPWLSNQGLNLEGLVWIEASRKLNNKGFVHLEKLKDPFRKYWKDMEIIRLHGNVYLIEMVLLIILFMVLERRFSPPTSQNCNGVARSDLSRELSLHQALKKSMSIYSNAKGGVMFSTKLRGVSGRRRTGKGYLRNFGPICGE